MFVKVLDKMEFKSVPASEVWDVYSTLTYARIVVELVPELFERIEVLKDNDGKVGTELHVYFKPNEYIPATPTKEVFAVVDNEKRVKVAEIAEGWFFDDGTLKSISANFKVTEKPKKEGEEEEEESCILEYGVEYEARDLMAASGAVNCMELFERINSRIYEYLIAKRKNKSA